MLIVVMMGSWFDDSAWLVVHDVRLYSVLETVVISGEDGCCSVVFDTLVVVYVLGVLWSELLMSFVIICPLWSSMCEYQSSSEDGDRSVSDVLKAVLYISSRCGG